MSNRNISEQRMVYQFLSNRSTSHKDERGELLKEYLDDQVGGLSDTMKEVVWRVGHLKNRNRALGLFLMDKQLLRSEMFGETKIQYSDEKKRESLIEAFQTPAEDPKTVNRPDWNQIPRAVIVPGVAKILDASALPNPDSADTCPMEQYVEIKCRQIE